MQHAPISRARYVQENRKMRFQEAYDGWSEGRLTQADAALILGQCERRFRRHIERFEADWDLAAQPEPDFEADQRVSW